mgnify:CR=1 FL=1
MLFRSAFAGARLAREVADEYSHIEPKWVFGSIGPGTKLPTLGHTSYEKLRNAYEACARGLIDGGADALLVETSQDLLQTKAAINGCRQALDKQNRNLLLIAQVTVETTGTMLLGSEIGAALTALEPLNIDVIGLNCATGPAEMSEHLRQLSQSSDVMLSCMPNAGLPILESGGARYPLSPKELAESLQSFVKDYGVNIVGGCCGTTPEHLGEVVALLIWKKKGGYGALGASYKPNHEPCVLWKKKGAKLNFVGSTKENRIWEEDKEGVNKLHPTQKPVSIPKRAIGNHKADIVLDLFGGSGSSLIACEQLGRKARLMELDPKYCDVIVKRWEAFTGKKAVLLTNQTETVN